jgi:hypothetical protein
LPFISHVERKRFSFLISGVFEVALATFFIAYKPTKNGG